MRLRKFSPGDRFLVRDKEGFADRGRPVQRRLDRVDQVVDIDGVTPAAPLVDQTVIALRQLLDHIDVPSRVGPIHDAGPQDDTRKSPSNAGPDRILRIDLPVAVGFPHFLERLPLTL